MITIDRRAAASALLQKDPRSISRQERRYLAANVDHGHWREHPSQLVELAEILLSGGFSRDAMDLLIKAEDTDDLRIQQLRSWALKTSGAPLAAFDILERLRERGERDAETLGFSGSVEKHLARLAGSSEEAEQHWRRGLVHYAAAFDTFGDIYNGINAATLSARCGLTSQSRSIAAKVAATCRGAIERGDLEYHTLATLGEAALIAGDNDEARAAYTQAVAIRDAGVGDIGSTKRQAEDLLTVLGRDPHELDDVFHLTTVVVFAGHRIDAAHRIRGFNEQRSFEIKQALKTYLISNNVGIGYAAAADGADILFLEALLSMGGQIHIVLPTDVDAFRKMSVDVAWTARFDRLIDYADSLTVTGEQIDPEDQSNLDYCNRVTLGMAHLKARDLGTTVSALTVWDGKRGHPGGTADSFAHWSLHDVPVTVLDPTTGAQTHPTHTDPPSTIGTRRIMAMVKADVVGYSRLSEREVAAFHEELLPRVAELCKQHGPIVKDTFGDEFYFVFEKIAQAAYFAFALQSLFRSTQLTIRIATHAGPLFACYDPIREGQNYTGRHASKVSRVEPVADENQILATHQFAALISVQCPDEFELVYAGERTLPKGYGSERLYVLTLRPSPDIRAA